jgi:hypothetical protein
MRNDLARQARAHLQPIADDRRRRGANLPDADVEAAAVLLVDLWAAATRHGITPQHRAWTFHLPRTALDVTVAVRRQGDPTRSR